MNTSSLMYFQTEFGQVFWNQDCSRIFYFCLNDAEYREEYMECLFDYFGVFVTYCEAVPDQVKKHVRELEQVGDDEYDPFEELQ